MRGSGLTTSVLHTRARQRPCHPYPWEGQAMPPSSYRSLRSSGMQVEIAALHKLGHFIQQHPPSFFMPQDWLESKLPMLITMTLSTFLGHLFSLLVWNLCTSCPADALIEKLRVIYEATAHDFYNAPPRTRSRDAHILVTVLSITLALLETRAWACQGRRLKKRQALASDPLHHMSEQ